MCIVVKPASQPAMLAAALLCMDWTAHPLPCPPCAPAQGGTLVLAGAMSAGALVSFMLFQQSLSSAFQVKGGNSGMGGRAAASRLALCAGSAAYMPKHICGRSACAGSTAGMRQVGCNPLLLECRRLATCSLHCRPQSAPLRRWAHAYAIWEGKYGCDTLGLRFSIPSSVFHYLPCPLVLPGG